MDFQTRFIAEISSKIATKEKQETTVKKASQKVINRRVQSRIDEAEGKITQLIEENTETSQKLTEVEQTIDGITQTVSSIETEMGTTTQKVSQIEQTVDGITQTVSNIETDLEDHPTTIEMNSAIEQMADEINLKIEQIEDLTRTVEGNKTITLEDCVLGDLLELHIYGNNTVFQELYPSNTLYPSNNLYPGGDSKILVNETEYELGVAGVLRESQGVCDEYVLEDGHAKVIRRINSDGTVKTKETIEDLGEYSIGLQEGDNEITIVNYVAKLKARYAYQNDYTDIFATKVEMNSSITQTAEEINLEVSKKVDENEVISKINQSAEQIQIEANKVNILGKKVKFQTEVSSTYNYTQQDLQNIQQYIMGEKDLTDVQRELYDINKDGKITSSDYVLIQNKIDDEGNVEISGTLEIDPDSASRTLILRDNSGNVATSIGMLRNGDRKF